MENQFNCAKPIWKKFSVAEKKMFNYVYEKCINNQDLVTHPNTPFLPEEEWTTIVYNVACFAAWGIKNQNIVIKDELVEREKS